MYIGIDPGDTGAICVLKGDDVTFMGTGCYDILEWFTNCKVAVEQQVALPRQKGAGKTMYNFGRLIGRLDAWRHDYIVVRPQEWYKLYGIPAGMEYKKRKLKTAEIMKELYPGQASKLYGPRGGLLDGRSDALAIAHWLKCHQETFS